MTSRAGRRRQRHEARHPTRAHALPVRVAPLGGATFALEVGGVRQSIVAFDDEPVGGYWTAMLPERCPARALLVGLGGATVARLLRARCPDTAITGIEHDETVLAAARAELRLDEIAGLRVVLAGAFEWVAAAAAREPASYDYICLDLFEAGRLAPGALATPFLRQVAALLAPGGELAVNLMVTGRTNEQLHRLGRVFAPPRTVRVRGNLVAFTRPLAEPGDGADTARDNAQEGGDHSMASALSEAELAELRAALEQRRAQLRGQIAGLRGAEGATGSELADPTADVRGDQADQSVDLEAWDTERQEELDQRTQLAEVEHALTKFAVGTYGACEECGQPIPLARLRIIPEARYDAAHQAERDARAAR